MNELLARLGLKDVNSGAWAAGPLDTSHGELVLELRLAQGDARAFLVEGGVAISYQQPRGTSVPAAALGELRTFAGALARGLRPTLGPPRTRLHMA